MLKQCRREESEEADAYETEPEDGNGREAREINGDPKKKKKFREIRRTVPSIVPENSLTNGGKPQAVQGESEDEPSADLALHSADVLKGTFENSATDELFESELMQLSAAKTWTRLRCAAMIGRSVRWYRPAARRTRRASVT